MAITRVTGQAAGKDQLTGTDITLAYPGNVTSGNLLVIGVAKLTNGQDTFLSTDISKSAGTATLGAFTLERQNEINQGNGWYNAVAVYSAPVTGTGSCTINVGVAADGSLIGLAEYTGIDVSDTRVDGVNGTTGATGAPDTGNVTSTAGALFFGVVCTNCSSNTAHTPDAAFSTIYEQEDGSQFQTGSVIEEIVTSQTTDSASWTAPTTVQWAASLAVYKAASAGTSSSVSPSVSPSASASPSASISPSVSPSPSISPSISVSPSVSPSASISPSTSVSPSISPSASPSPSTSVSPSVSPSTSVSPSVSPSISASASLSQSSSVSASPSPSTPPYSGIAWGVQTPASDEQAKSWSVWQTAPATPVSVTGDPDWGKADILNGTPALGSVEDLGDTSVKTFGVTCPKYGTNTGNVIISIRGSASAFAQHDVSPTWSVYSAPVSQAWRYVQLKLEYAA